MHATIRPPGAWLPVASFAAALGLPDLFASEHDHWGVRRPLAGGKRRPLHPVTVAVLLLLLRRGVAVRIGDEH